MCLQKQYWVRSFFVLGWPGVPRSPPTTADPIYTPPPDTLAASDPPDSRTRFFWSHTRWDGRFRITGQTLNIFILVLKRNIFIKRVRVVFIVDGGHFFPMFRAKKYTSVPPKQHKNNTNQAFIETHICICPPAEFFEARTLYKSFVFFLCIFFETHIPFHSINTPKNHNFWYFCPNAQDSCWQFRCKKCNQKLFSNFTLVFVFAFYRVKSNQKIWMIGGLKILPSGWWLQFFGNVLFHNSSVFDIFSKAFCTFHKKKYLLIWFMLTNIEVLCFDATQGHFIATIAPRTHHRTGACSHMPGDPFEGRGPADTKLWV